ncbi:MAG TPA: hypothetical protein VK634_06880 [Reyranella sp.]|nr:hypothetical protein [Reyranella sp.]HTE80399.1 hypothetical protein [Reyranella sp.]
MKTVLLAAVLSAAVALGGCALLNPTKPLQPDTVVDLQKRAYAAKLAFQGVLTGAVVYIETPRCGRPASPPICSQQAVVDVMRNALKAGDAGTQAAEEAARSLTADSTALGALVTAAEKSVAALQSIVPKT